VQAIAVVGNFTSESVDALLCAGSSCQVEIEFETANKAKANRQ
jgi:hypothetical protein